MASDIKLQVYTFQVKRQRKDEYASFDELYIDKENPSQSTFFHKLFKNFINSFDNKFSVHKRSGKAISLSLNENGKTQIHLKNAERLIYGQFDGGLTGSSTSVRSQAKANDEIIKLDRDMVASRKFYFLLWVPSDSNMGISIIQGLGNESYGDMFQINLMRFFRNNTPYVLKMGEHISKEYAEKFKNEGKVKEVHLRRLKVSNSKMAKMFKNWPSFEGADFDIELKISPENLFGNTKFEEFFTGEKTVVISERLNDVGFDDASKTLVKYEFNGKTTTASSDKNFKVAPAYYIDESSIGIDADGHPIFDKIHQHCLAFLQNIKKDIGYLK